MQAYLDSRPLKENTLKDLSALAQTIRTQKQTVFSAELREFDALRSAYHASALGLGAYAEKLTRIAGEENIPLILSQFIEAARIEKKLDFPTIDQQRKQVFEKLTRALSEQETQQLIADSMAYREGKIGFGAYYQSFRTLCAQRGVDLRQTPMFDSYIHYVLLTDGIKADEDFFAALGGDGTKRRRQIDRQRRAKNTFGKKRSLGAGTETGRIRTDRKGVAKIQVHRPSPMEHRPKAFDV